MLSGGGVGGELRPLELYALAHPENIAFYDPVTGVIVTKSVYYDSDEVVTHLKMLRREDGTYYFEVNKSPEVALTGSWEDSPSRDFSQGLGAVVDNSAVVEIQVRPEIDPIDPPAEPFPVEVPPVGGPKVAIDDMLLVTLRSIVDPPAGQAAGDTVASNSVHVDSAQSIPAGVPAPASPAQRIRLEQGVWDRAWAFEMTGFAAPADAAGGAAPTDPHFETAFQQFPSINRELDSSEAIADDATLTAAAARRRHDPADHDGAAYQKASLPRPQEAAASVLAARTPIEAAFGEAGDAPRDEANVWWSARLERGRDLGVTVAAIVIARQAWLHSHPAAQPDDKRNWKRPTRH